jgi:hypothetical protein
MNKNVNVLKNLAFFLLGVSFLLVILGVYFYSKEDKFLSQCQLIKCRVIEIEEKHAGNAYVTFLEINGNYKPFTLYFEYDISDEKLGYELNEVYEIYYYSKDVSKSEEKNFFVNHITSFILIVIGFSFMLDFPILLFISNKSQQRKSSDSITDLKNQVISE